MDIPDFIEWVKDVERDDLTADELSPKVLWFDKDCDFARLTLLPHGDWMEDLPRPVAMLTAAQVNAGHIVVVSDAVRPLTATKPDGTPWQPGDATAALRVGLTDLIAESLLITIVDTDGTITDVSTIYHRHPDGPITYDETTIDTYEFGDVRCEGRLVWLLRAAIQEPKAYSVLVEALGGHPPPEIEAVMHIQLLALTTKTILQQLHWNCLIGAAGPEEQEVLRAALNDGVLTEGLRVFDRREINEINDLETNWNLS